MTPERRITIQCLRNRIQNAREGGQPDNQIRAGLIAEWWGVNCVNEAFEQLDKEQGNEA